MWKQTFRLQFYTMIRKRSFFFMLLVISILTAFFSLKMVWEFKGMDRSSLYPAWFMWNHNQLISYTPVSPGIDYLNLLGFCSLLLVPLLGPMAYVDSFYDHLKSGVLIGILPRCTRRTYYTTGAFVSFIGAAAVFSIPFLLEQLLCSFCVLVRHNKTQQPIRHSQTLGDILRAFPRSFGHSKWRIHIYIT